MDQTVLVVEYAEEDLDVVLSTLDLHCPSA
jgi:hypothetical protein